MGAGHAYPYRHFMLIDMDHDYFYESYSDGEQEFSQIMYDDFLHDLMISANADPVEKWEGRNVKVVFSTENVNYAIDSGGGMPALFAYPADEEEHDINDVEPEIIQAFNEFVRIYDVFRRSTSAWTSEPYKDHYSKE